MNVDKSWVEKRCFNCLNIKLGRKVCLACLRERKSKRMRELYRKGEEESESARRRESEGEERARE